MTATRSATAVSPAPDGRASGPDEGEARQDDAFLSYSRADQPFAQTLHAALTDLGKHAWADWRDIPPSAPWPLEIDQAIERAEAFVFVLSPS